MISLIILSCLKAIQLESSSFINISSFIIYSTTSQNTKNISFSLFNQRKKKLNNLEIESNNITFLSNMNNITISNEKKNKVILLQDYQFIDFLMNCSNNQNYVFIFPIKSQYNFTNLSFNDLTIIIISNNDFEELLNEIHMISSIFIYLNISQTYLFPYNFYIFSPLFIESLFIFIYIKILCSKNSNLCSKNLLKIISRLIIYSSSFFILYVFFFNNYLSFKDDFYLYKLFYFLCNFGIILSKFFIFTLFLKLSHGEKFLFHKKTFNKVYLFIFTIIEIIMKNMLNNIQLFYPAIIVFENIIMFYLCLSNYFINLRKISLFKKKILINIKISLFHYFFNILQFKTKILKNIIILIILYTYFTIVFITFYYILLYDFDENILINFFLIEWTIIIILIIILFPFKKPLFWNLNLNEINRICLCYEKKYYKCKIHFNENNNWKNIETNIEIPLLIISPFVNNNQILFDNIKVGYRIKEYC